MAAQGTELNQDDAIAIKVRCQTAIFAANQALDKVIETGIGGSEMENLLRNGIQGLRQIIDQCNDAMGLSPYLARQIDG